MENAKNKMEITTIKLLKSTKTRFDKLRSYPKESYDTIIQKLLEILNTCRINPEKAKSKLVSIDQEHKKNIMQIQK